MSIYTASSHHTQQVSSCKAELDVGLPMQLYIPPTDKEQLLLELQKPSRLVKALQALFDDRCLSYIKKDVMMGVLKDLVKTHRAISKAQNKLAQDTEGRPFNLLQMIIRYVLLFPIQSESRTSRLHQQRVYE